MKNLPHSYSLFVFITLLLFSCQQKNYTTISPNAPSIIPIPNELVYNNGQFELSSNTNLLFSDEFSISANFLKNYIENSKIKLQTNKGKNHIEFIKHADLPEEAYQLDITKQAITIKASSDQGAFYAVQSIRQLLPATFEHKNNVSKLSLPTLSIKDEPRFTYRGMHLDVGRHMFSAEFIKKYIDAMALLKMNTFHWHLTEDQGWRIEIEKYPELNTVSSYRKETLVGHYNDQPHQFDGKRYGGFYTKEEIRDIVKYATERHVTIIPEVEMPGHSQAVIAAYPELGCTGKRVEVATKWGVFEEVYCPTEKTFAFLEDVLDEVMELFPSEYIHIGGDEAPKKRWEESPYCQQLIKKEGLKDEHELQNYFITRIEKYLNSKGRQIIGWDEILEGGLAPNATVMSWRGINGAIEAAKQHHNVVMTPTSHCYFDYYQSEDPNEPTAFGGFLPLEKVYSFNPIPDEITPEQEKYVLGAQGNVWTEYMPTEQQVEYMAFPRMLAMSEVTWSAMDNKNYDEFTKRLEVFHKRLDALDINYANHLYELSGTVNKAAYPFYTLQTSSNQPHEIFYTTDGSEPTSQSKKYDKPIDIQDDLNIKAIAMKNGKKVGATFSQTIKNHKALMQTVTLSEKPHGSYLGSGAAGLVNGISGSNTRFGDKEWIGYSGKDFTVTIDFNEPTEIQTIATRFHNNHGQWIYAPRAVGILVNGEHYGTLIINDYEKLLTDFKYKLPQAVQAEKLELKVINYGIIPEGRQGAGHKAWTFIDEIIVK